jgi:hypothetical protein
MRTDHCHPAVYSSKAANQDLHCKDDRTAKHDLEYGLHEGRTQRHVADRFRERPPFNLREASGFDIVLHEQ